MEISFSSADDLFCFDYNNLCIHYPGECDSIIYRSCEKKKRPITVYNSDMKEDTALITCQEFSDKLFDCKCSFIVVNNSSRIAYLNSNDLLSVWDKTNSDDKIEFENGEKAKGVQQFIKPGECVVVNFRALHDETNIKKIQSFSKAVISFDLKTIDPETIPGIFGEDDRNLTGLFGNFKKIEILKR